MYIFFLITYIRLADKKSPINRTKIYLVIHKLDNVDVGILEDLHELNTIQRILCGCLQPNIKKPFSEFFVDNTKISDKSDSLPFISLSEVNFE